jgi:anti-sigma regulatory factor (Ser/Thr protein kinase)
MQKEFKRSISQLDNLFSFISQFVEKFQIGLSEKNTIDLAVEEIFTNMVKYNPQSSARIQLKLDYDDSKISVCLTDTESQPFDLTKARVYDLEQPAKERPIGKLGLHLVKQLMDSVDYSYTDGTAVITMVKYLGEGNVQD